MNLEILLALTAALLWGIGDFWAAIPSRRLDRHTVMFFEGLMGLFIYLVVWVIWIRSWPAFDMYTMAAVVGSGIFAFMGIRAMFTGLQSGKVGVVIPIANANALVAVIFGVVFFSESLSAVQVLGVCAVLVGIVLLSFRLADIRSLSLYSPAIAQAFLAMFSFGFMYVCLAYATAHIPAFHAALLSSVTSLALVVLATKDRARLFSIRNVGYKNLAHIWGISLTYIIGFLVFVYALEIGRLSVVAVIAGASPFISAVLGHMILKDRLTTFQYAMIGVVISGVALLSL